MVGGWEQQESVKVQNRYNTIRILQNNTQESPEKRCSKLLQSTSMMFLKRDLGMNGLLGHS